MWEGGLDVGDWLLVLDEGDEGAAEVNDASTRVSAEVM